MLLGAALVATSASRGAEPTSAEKETARSLMDAGYARRNHGDHAGALEAFLGADAIMHVPTTGVAVAREQVALGRLVEARETLRRVTRPPAPADEPAPFRAAREEARRLDDELLARIGGLQITIVGLPEGVIPEVTIDGTVVPWPALVVAPFRVNPGRHVVTVRARRRLLQQEAVVSEAEVTPISFAMPPPSPTDAAGEPGPPPTPASSSMRDWLRWGGLGLLGAGLTTGAVTGILSFTKRDSLNNECVDYRCLTPASSHDLNVANTLATTSTVAFFVAAAGGGLFLASFFVGSPNMQSGVAPPTVHSGVVPWVGPASAGLRGSF
jgi:hypothetical protein